MCERVVVVAHSLGTAIAYETLLNLGRRARAEQSGDESEAITPLLPKLSHFITFGSPIDRISYFFNLHFSRYHRFNKVSDELAGTTWDTPFRLQKVRALRWINVRDAADPVASRLFAPRSPFPNRDDIVEVEVANSHMPNPVGAHTGYFDSTLSAKVLFDACILNRPQVQLQETRPSWSKRFAAFGRTFTAILCVVAIACLMTGALAFWTLQPGTAVLAQAVFLTASGAITAVFGLGWLIDKRHSLKLPD
jgi:hypothetical protein